MFPPTFAHNTIILVFTLFFTGHPFLIGSSGQCNYYNCSFTSLSLFLPSLLFPAVSCPSCPGTMCLHIAYRMCKLHCTPLTPIPPQLQKDAWCCITKRISSRGESFAGVFILCTFGCNNFQTAETLTGSSLSPPFPFAKMVANSSVWFSYIFAALPSLPLTWTKPFTKNEKKEEEKQKEKRAWDAFG